MGINSEDMGEKAGGALGVDTLRLGGLSGHGGSYAGKMSDSPGRPSLSSLSMLAPSLASSSKGQASSPFPFPLSGTVRSRGTTKSSLGPPERPARAKNSVLGVKHGQKHHTYDREKAPYPICYDRIVLQLESLTNRFIRHLRHGSVTFVNYERSDHDPESTIERGNNVYPPPERCLDLGCGMGTWIIDAAKEWPGCEFVGFDLVNVQIPSALLGDDLEDRITWRHGNFLTTRLPFGDDDFDHIHIQGIAKGVPENKWQYLFEEVNRVLRPGGAVEVIDEDIMFPVLSRSFTEALHRPKRSTTTYHSDFRISPSNLSGLPSVHNHSPSNSVSTGSNDSQTETVGSGNEPQHHHMLLESLYTSVFEHRFINLRPIAVLPSYFQTYFRHVTLGPIVSFPMPPLAPPLPPAPVSSNATNTVFDVLGFADPAGSASPTSSLQNNKAFPSPPMHPTTRLASLSISSTASKASTASTTETNQSSVFSTGRDDMEVRGRSYSDASGHMYSTPNTSGGLLLHESCKDSGQNSRPSVSNSGHSANPASEEMDPKGLPQNFKLFELDFTDTPSEQARALIDTEILGELSARSLSMHLYHSYLCVLACQEAMWEELKDRLLNRPKELEEKFGWDKDEELESLPKNRQKFEKLMERFRVDMEARCAFWAEMCEGFDWKFPPREELSKAELIEDERIRDGMIKARREALKDVSESFCRNLRVLVGFKD